MKNIKPFLLAFIFIGLLSCEDDSFSRAFVDNEVKIPLTGSLSISKSERSIFSEESIDYTISLPQSFDVESTVEITITSTFNSFAFDPFDQKIYVTIPVESNTVNGTLNLSDLGAEIPFLGAPVSISLTGIALSQPEREDENGKLIDPFIPIDDPYTLTSEIITLNILESNPWSGINEDALQLSIDWQGPYTSDQNDLDLYIYPEDPDADSIEASESSNRFEGSNLINSAQDAESDFHADGKYFIEIAIWTSIDETPIPYRLAFSYQDGTREIFNGVVDPAIGFTRPIVLTIATNPEGDKIYSIEPNI